MACTGDWVAGISSRKGGKEPQLLYAMRIDEILSFDEYWLDPRFLVKRPNFTAAGEKFLYGDNIYHRGADNSFCQEYSRHRAIGCPVNKRNLDRDTVRTNNVLISKFFSYFGDRPKPIPMRLRNAEELNFVHKGTGESHNFSEGFIAKAVSWLEGLERGVHGTSADLAKQSQAARRRR
jgi:hypothetical protein